MPTSLSRGVQLAISLVLAIALSAAADPVTCQKTIARKLQRFKKTHLKAHLKCLRLENLGRINGPCPDTSAQAKIQRVRDVVVAKIASECTMSDIAALGFPSDCAFEPATTGIEGDCANPLLHPVTTSAEFGACLICWKGAELSEFMALLFASHASEVCGGSVDATSPVCSDLDCTTPFPEQHSLGDTSENDCQVGIGKAGIRYLIKREKTLERCALDGGTRATCLGDATVQEKLLRAADSKEALIQRKCGNNRVPTAAPAFCCKDGQGNSCTMVATRDDCETGGGTVQEGKTCELDLTCHPVMGPNKPITWWENCPESDTCPGATLTDTSGLIGCVDTAADAIVDELICLQFPRNGGADWPCPADVD